MRKRHCGWARRFARRLRALEAQQVAFTRPKPRQDHAYDPVAEGRRRDEDLLRRKRQ